MDVPGKIKGLHAYVDLGLEGANSNMTTRLAVKEQLLLALRSLPPGHEFWVFDAFRSRQTQLALFQFIYRQQSKLHPLESDKKIWQLTRQFVAHPDETSRFAIPPHNSGGAVDLTLAFNGTPLDMGTEFDEVSPFSETVAFEKPWNKSTPFSEERWRAICENRRLLFNTMKSVGFVNYVEEWWHYDLGDCIWAQTLKQDWHFPTME